MKKMQVIKYKPRSLGSLWRLGYSWRWNKPYPTNKNERHWWIMAASTFRKIQEDHEVDNFWVRNAIIWFWTTKSFFLVESMTVQPGGLQYYVNEFKAWLETYKDSLSSYSVAEIGMYYHPHESCFSNPWETEEE